MKKGNGERFAFAVVIVTGLIGLFILLWGAGIIDFSASITGSAVDEINQPPEFTGTSISTAQNAAITIDLSTQFTDPEGQPLTFIVAEEDVIAVSIDESIATFTPEPGFSGERTLTIIATDGENVVRAPVKMTVGEGVTTPEQVPEPEPEAPAAISEPIPLPPEESGGFGGQGFTTQDTCSTCAGCTTCMGTDDTLCSLTADISATGNCINILGNRTFLNCSGRTITYDTSGGGAHGINGTNINDVSIKDCVLVDGAGDNGFAMRFAESGNFTIFNNTIRFNSTGISLATGGVQEVRNNTIANNTFISNFGGTAISSVLRTTIEGNIITSGVGIATFSSTQNIRNNTIIAYRAQGIDMQNPANSNITGNVVHANTTGFDPDTSLSALIENNTFFANFTGLSIVAGSGGPSGTRVVGNTIVMNGTTPTAIVLGIVGAGGTNNVLAARNQIIVEGTGVSRGILVQTNGLTNANNNVTSNNITVLGAEGIAIQVHRQAHNVTIINNTLNAFTWLNLSNDLPINFSDNVFETEEGSIRFGYFNTTGNATINQTSVNITFNNAFVNSTRFSFLNVSSTVTLRGITANNPDPVVDFNDDGVFAACPAGICTEISFTGGDFVYNVTQFTQYSSQSTNITACPVTINVSTTLTQNLISNDTCITIGSSNLTLDCAGFSIFYNANGGNSEVGVFSSGTQNITINNCVIRDINATGSNNPGINLTKVNNSIVQNTTIQTNGTDSNRGIILDVESNRNRVENSVILTRGDSVSNSGVAIYGSNNNLTNNTIRTNGTSDNHGVEVYNGASNNAIKNQNIIVRGNSSVNLGVYVLNAGIDNLVFGNNITAHSVLSAMGIRIEITNNTNVSSNTIQTNELLAGNNGIQIIINSSNNIIEHNKIAVIGGLVTSGITISVNSTQNLIINNNVTAILNGTSGSAVTILTGSHNNIFERNNITVNKSTGNFFAIRISNSNGTRFNNTLLNDPKSWIRFEGSITTEFTNTTFQTPNGSINILGNFLVFNNTFTLGFESLNITSNNAFLNSSNLSFLNQSAIITLNGISFSDPQPTVDREDDGTFVACLPNADPFCTELSFSGGVFVYNTSHFTQFSSQETTAETFGTLVINSSITLDANITSNGTGVVISGNSSIFLNCSGFTIIYGANGIQNDTMGINVTNSANITIRDCIIRKGNTTSGARSYGIGLFNASDALVVNNTVLTNGSEDNDGIHARTTVFGTNNVVTNIGDINNPFCANTTSGVGLCNVCFTTPGVQCTTFLQSACTDGEGFKTDTLVRFNLTSAPDSGFIKVLGGENVICRMNNVVILQFGVRNNCGVLSQAAISPSAFINNAENNLSCSVAGSGEDEDNGFKLSEFTYTVPLPAPGGVRLWNNTILSNGGNLSDGIFMEVSNSTVQGNNITTSGVILGHGINLQSLARQNNVTSNDIGAEAGLSDAIRLVSNDLNTLLDNTLTATDAAIRVDRALGNTFNQSFISLSTVGTSLLVAEADGTINFTQTLNITNGTLLASIMNISLNSTFLNSSNANGSQFNGSALLTLFNLQIDTSSARPLVDREDDDSFVGCLNPDCTSPLYNKSSGLFQFNAASFTTYAGTPLSDCDVLDLPFNQTNATFELLNNVSAGINVTCFRIISENITLDCNGFKINGSVNTGVISGIGTGTGINASNTKNIVVRNCIIEDFYVNLAFLNVTDSAITNVSSFNSTEEGIFLLNSHNNTIENNTAFSNRSRQNNQRAAPITLTGSTDNVLINNTANTSSGANNGKFAIVLETSSDNNVLKDNVVFDANFGINAFSSNNNTLINNSATVNGSAFSVRGNNNVLLRNFGFSQNTDGLGLDLADNNIVRNNTFVGGATSRTIDFSDDADSNIIENNNLSTVFANDVIFIAGSTSNIIANNTIISALSGRGIRMEVFEFIIETYTNGSWYNVTTVDLVRQREAYRYAVKNVTLPAGTINVRITHYGTDTAHLDFVLLDDTAPLTVLDNNTGSQPPAKLAAADYDVIDAVKRTIEFTWANPGTTLAIGGVEENLRDIAPYSWPLDEGNFTYTIGDSELREINWQPTSAHPNGTIYLDFSTTATALQVNVDMTPDNTLDPGGDWMEIRIITPVVKEYRINTTDFTWGTHAYEYTENVVWQHKTYNFTIPLSELGASSGDTIEYRLGYYGTGGGNPCNNNVIINNTIVVNTGHAISADTCTGIIVRNNNITTNSSDGVNFVDVDNGEILFNNITSITGDVMDLSSTSDNNLIGNNTVSTSSGFGVRFSSNSWPDTLINNSLRSDNSTVVFISGPTHVLFGNTLSTNIGTPLVFTSTAANVRVDNTTIFTNGTVWFDLQATANNTNFTNTLFENDDGSIRVLSKVSSNGAANVTRDKLNVTFNNAYMNSTNLSFLNASTQIILRTLQFIDPFPVVDLEDDNTFANCFPARCEEETVSPGNNFVFNVTGFTSYQATEGNVNLTLAKTDSPDPVNSSLQLNYSIDINNTGTSEALNITVTDTYPPRVIFLSASPAPVSGTNNTFFIGNLSPQYNFTINISVFVVNLSNGTIINNTVNITFLNQSNATLTANVTESTTVITPIPFNFTNLSVTKADSPDPVENDTFLNYTITVTANGGANGTAFNVTVNETYPPELIFISASPTPLAGTNNTFILGNMSGGTSAVINITLFVTNLSNSTIINNTVNVTANNETGALLRVDDTESTTVQNSTGAPAPPPPPAAAPGQGGGGGGSGGIIIREPEIEAPAEACIESWACEGWSSCADGTQTRECIDLNFCNSTQYKPFTNQKCEVVVPAQVVEPMPEIKPPVEAVEEPTFTWPRFTLPDICVMLPIIIDALLVILAVLAIVHLSLVMMRKTENVRPVQMTNSALMIIIFALLTAHYFICSVLLMLEYVVLVIIVLATIVVQVLGKPRKPRAKGKLREVDKKLKHAKPVKIIPAEITPVIPRKPGFFSGLFVRKHHIKHKKDQVLDNLRRQIDAPLIVVKSKRKIKPVKLDPLSKQLDFMRKDEPTPKQSQLREVDKKLARAEQVNLAPVIPRKPGIFSRLFGQRKHHTKLPFDPRNDKELKRIDRKITAPLTRKKNALEIKPLKLSFEAWDTKDTADLDKKLKNLNKRLKKR